MQAFSLPELAVALVLVGILTTLGVSRYNAYVARARQAEAKVNLAHIASLQGIYRSQHLKYNTLSNVGAKDGGRDCGTGPTGALSNDLGFRPDGCDKLRYGYSCPSSDCGTSGFEARAKSRTNPATGQEIYPSCDASDKSDTWTIDHDLDLENSHPISKKCSK